MNDMAIEKVLQQIREIRQKTDAPLVEPTEKNTEFQNMLVESIDQVNETQQKSSALKHAFEMGDENVTLPEVMIASQKASIAFQATLQVRNRVLEAYRDVMNMQL